MRWNGLNRTPLKRSTQPLKRTPIRKRSKKMEAAYSGSDGRRAFVAKYLDRWPICMVQWENCTGRSQDVHEWWARGIGGAIVPGDKADRQQQRFIAICRRCHGELDEQPDRAKEEGWKKGTTA
tara:strand:+ start:427 stop:795 length:369 start_codon:yes stop_codon:yes gene_type:complete